MQQKNKNCFKFFVFFIQYRFGGKNGIDAEPFIERTVHIFGLHIFSFTCILFCENEAVCAAPRRCTRRAAVFFSGLRRILFAARNAKSSWCKSVLVFTMAQYELRIHQYGMDVALVCRTGKPTGVFAFDYRVVVFRSGYQ